MKKSGFLLKNDGGFAIVVAIMVLAILMIGGLLASNVSVTDLGMVRNSRIHSESTAAAESAAMMAAQYIENIPMDAFNVPTTIKSVSVSLNPATSLTDIINPFDIENLVPLPVAPSANAVIWQNVNNADVVSGVADPGATRRYAIFGVTNAEVNSTTNRGGGSSLNNAEPMLRDYKIRAQYISARHGSVEVMMGYRKKCF